MAPPSGVRGRPYGAPASGVNTSGPPRYPTDQEPPV